MVTCPAPNFHSYTPKTSSCSVPSLPHSSSLRTAPACDYSACCQNQCNGASEPRGVLPRHRRCATCWVEGQSSLQQGSSLSKQHHVAHTRTLLRQLDRAAATQGGSSVVRPQPPLCPREARAQLATATGVVLSPGSGSGASESTPARQKAPAGAFDSRECHPPSCPAPTRPPARSTTSALSVSAPVSGRQHELLGQYL